MCIKTRRIRIFLFESVQFGYASCLLFCFFFFNNFVYARDNQKEQANILWSIQRINELNDEEKESIVKSANNILTKKIDVITDKDFMFVNDTHYYVSVAPYWWPDTLQNGRIEFVRKDGQTNPNKLVNDWEKLHALAKSLKTLSIAYYLTDCDIYYTLYQNFIEKWFVSAETKMYPNFEYAQLIPGRNDNRGRPTGIIEGYVFNDILESFRLINTKKKITNDIYSSFENWCEQFLNWLSSSENGIKQSQANTNLGIAYDVVLLNFAVFCNRDEIVNKLLQEFLNKRLKKQIMCDGSQSAELKRTRAFYYSIFNLTHIIDFCLIQKAIGDSSYVNNMEYIRNALNFLLQFVGNASAFPYTEIGNWKELEIKLKAENDRVCDLLFN